MSSYRKLDKQAENQIKYMELSKECILMVKKYNFLEDLIIACLAGLL